jgi:hypothetical protein
MEQAVAVEARHLHAELIDLLVEADFAITLVEFLMGSGGWCRQKANGSAAGPGCRTGHLRSACRRAASRGTLCSTLPRLAAVLADAPC